MAQNVFLLNPLLFLLVFYASISSSSPPVILEHPRDWNEDAAFGDINITTTAPNGAARFSCKAMGSPVPSISWFVALNGTGFRQVETNSSQFLLLDSDLVINSPELTKPVVFCEASSPEGRVCSHSARFRKWGRLNPMVRSYMHPTWISKSHALVICADRGDYIKEEITPEGATIHKIRSWGDVYSYGAYYDDHSRLNNNQNFLSVATRSDIYWHEPFIVITTNVTHYKDVLNLFFCQQIWSPHFITGTQQKPKNYMHGNKRYPATDGGLYVRYPYLNKRIYTHVKPNNENLTDVSLRLLLANNEQFWIGKNLTIDCLTMSDDQTLKATWFHKMKPITSSHSRVRSQPIIFFGQQLIIEDLAITDAGDYTCVASDNRTKKYSATISVKPKLPLDFALDSNTSNLTRVLQEGSRLSLECRYQVIGNKTSRSVIWLFNGSKARGHQSDYPGQSQLIVTDLEAGKDDGCYQCLLQDASDIINPFVTRTIACVRLTPPPRPEAPVITIATRGQSKPVVRVDQNGTLFGPPILVTVTDEEAGRGGRIESCAVILDNTTQPLSSVLSLRNVAAFHLDTLQIEEDQEEVRLECYDTNQPPVKSSIIVTVERCNAQCPARPLPEKEGFRRRLIRLLGATLNEISVDRWLSDLERLTLEAERKDVAPEDFDLFLSVIRTAVRSPAMAQRLDKIVLDLSRLLSAKMPGLGAEARRNRRLSNKVLNLTEAIAAALPTPNKVGEAKVLRSQWISVAVIRLPPRPQRQPGAVAHFLVPPGESASRPVAATATKTHFPTGSFGICLSQAAVQGDRLEFAMAAPNAVFWILGNSFGDSKIPQVPASPIMSATADLTSPEEHQEVPVTLALPLPSSVGREDALCTFWDFWAQRWSTAGCEKIAAGRGRFVYCRCQHLTNFALLLDVDRATAVDGEHQTILSVLSYALLTISTVFLLLTVLIYASFLHRETRRMSSGHSSTSRESRITASRVLLSLCTALLLATLVFLAGSHYNQSGTLCTLVGVLLHYFYLTVFFWSVVEAAHICITVIYVSLKSNQISIHISHFFIKASAFAWGLPVVIIAVTIGINRTANYGTDLAADYRFCFLARDAFFVAFLGPMLVCLTANIIILILLALVLRRYAFASDTKGPGKKKNQWRQHLVGFIGICFILNVTWIIGALQVNAVKLSLQYLHVLINGLQGLFIFIFYCLLRSDIRNFVRKKLRRAFGQDEKPSGTSRTGTSDTNSMMTSGERRPHHHEVTTKTELVSVSVVNDPPASNSEGTPPSDGNVALLNSDPDDKGDKMVV